MGRYRFVKGTTVEIVHGDINYISENNITDNGNFVNHYGKENGNFYGSDNKDINIDDIIKDGFWTDLKNNKISKALLGETVRFHIETEGVPDNITLLVRVYEYNTINDIKLGTIKSVTLKNNKGYFEFFLNKKAWKKLLKNIGKGKELELYCNIMGWGSSIEKGKYLKVENEDKAIAFFLGGAADKESYYFSGPFKNIQDAQIVFENSLSKNLKSVKFYSSYYLDYSDAFDDIYNKITSNIFEKATKIYIIGHSLGGWNGAHLSQILTDKGYDVNMLITLDPVGEGLLVFIGSNIYPTKPKPKSDFWINLKAVPKKPDQSDSVAEFGERWNVKSGPNINNEGDFNHYNAKKMFTIKLTSGKSACEHLLEAVNFEINK